MSTRRPARFAGSWYPDSPPRLRALLEAAAVAAGKRPEAGGSGQGKLVGALLPHAGLGYSAPCQLAGLAGFASWRGQAPRILILAPSHYLPLDPDQLYSSDLTSYDTPLGELAGWLPATTHRCWNQYRQAMLQEHAIELLLPAIAWLVPDAEIFPVLVGPVSSETKLAGLADTLADILRQGGSGQRPCLVLASSDMTHYGARFRHTPFGADGPEAWRAVAERDLAACRLVASGDGEGLLRRQDELAPTMCGRFPAALLAALARRRGWSGQTVGHYRSDQAEQAQAGQWPGGLAMAAPDREGAGEGFVSYAAIRFTVPEN